MLEYITDEVYAREGKWVRFVKENKVHCLLVIILIFSLGCSIFGFLFSVTSILFGEGYDVIATLLVMLAMFLSCFSFIPYFIASAALFINEPTFMKKASIALMLTHLVHFCILAAIFISFIILFVCNFFGAYPESLIISGIKGSLLKGVDLAITFSTSLTSVLLISMVYTVMLVRINLRYRKLLGLSEKLNEDQFSFADAEELFSDYQD